MATFNMGSAGDISLVTDFAKVQSYLYKLERQLRYMFNNLTPEDNYSEEARLIYVAGEEKQSSLEVALDHISLSMVDKDNIISAINLSEEGVKIQGEKISMEGVVTVNSYFKIGLDGSMEATNGRFSGDISASTITGSVLNAGGSGNAGQIIIYSSTGTEIGRWDNKGISVKSGTLDIRRGSDIGLYCNGNVFRFGDFGVYDGYGRQILQSSDTVTGMSGEPDEDGKFYLWAGWDGTDAVFAVTNEGRIEINGTIYYNGKTLLKYIQNICEAIIEDKSSEDIPPGSLS